MLAAGDKGAASHQQLLQSASVGNSINSAKTFQTLNVNKDLKHRPKNLLTNIQSQVASGQRALAGTQKKKAEKVEPRTVENPRETTLLNQDSAILKFDAREQGAMLT